jgi:hypothetical protein
LIHFDQSSPRFIIFHKFYTRFSHVFLAPLPISRGAEKFLNCTRRFQHKAGVNQRLSGECQV